MAITFDAAQLAAFFGMEPETTLIEDWPGRLVIFDHSGRLLKYAIHLSLDQEQVAVSADTTTPFCAQSMYEFYIPCDRITAAPDPMCGGKTFLIFWYGGQDVEANLRMTMYRRDDDELVVWPRLFSKEFNEPPKR